MGLKHYHTDNWLICSKSQLRKFLDWAVQEDGDLNLNLKGSKVLLVESSLEDMVPQVDKVYIQIFQRLMMLSRHLEMDLIILSNFKPEYLDLRLRRLVEDFKEWK